MSEDIREPMNESGDNGFPVEFRVPQENSVCTEVCYNFQRQHYNVFDFFFFGLHLTTRADAIRLKAAEALAYGKIPEDLKNLEDVKKDPQPTFKKLQSFGNLRCPPIFGQ